jgi:hypothetical protein
MIGRIFTGGALIFLFVLAVGGFLLGLIRGKLQKDPTGKKIGTWTGALLNGLESAVLTIVGGLLARGVVSVLLTAADDPDKAAKAIGWAFFLVPGMVDAVAGLAGERLLTTPGALMWIATTVGAFAGLMDGVWKIHDWKGLGWLGFPLDLTWGLAGTTLGGLLHLINFSWGDHAEDGRSGSHHYQSGFRLIDDFAFTQGSVMSNTKASTTTQYKHEMVHVWQNRIFGAFYVLSYLAWLVIWFVPGMFAGWIKGDGLGHGIKSYCYLNNPWEVVAYAIQGEKRSKYDSSDLKKQLVWSIAPVVFWSIAFFAGAVIVFFKIASAIW